MTKDDRKLLRSMFLLLFTMLWNIASLLQDYRVEYSTWKKLYEGAMKIANEKE